MLNEIEGGLSAGGSLLGGQKAAPNREKMDGTCTYIWRRHVRHQASLCMGPGY